MTKALVTLVLASTMALGACSTGKKPKQETAAIAVTTPTTVTIPEPTTTTTIPETTTTTIRRIVTTTTTEPQPEPATPAVADDGTVSLSDPDMGKWQEIALCEMPGPGGVPSEPWGAHWTFIASRFSGALGIANTTWAAFGGTEFGPTAGHATWQQQIIVARRIRDRHGYSAWGCG